MNETIPKIIHYCWFGGNEKPETVVKYINTWKKVLPEYEIMEWNESNFPIDYCKYTEEAYRVRKYAFVSDVARLYALNQFGGIYFDTDVEVRKSLDNYLDAAMILSYESKTLLMTGFFATTKKNPIIEELIDEYKMRIFIKKDGSLNTTTNTIYMTKCLEKHGVSTDCIGIRTKEGYRVFDYRTFGAFDADNSYFEISDQTVLVHHCLASWGSRNFRLNLQIKKCLASIAGGKPYKTLRKFMHKG